ncbi:GGDEF domain-containing protein [Hahella sp. CCB-MM4]|uniref:putative bifunctional diguanylate cyclase/phosphodiesterase n=1 Tax=Hahella sp. (strain CCB-MM4) TaxID=1926491 RepID=UPI000B9B4F67|nr:EAL domain-containing protein [Hahella sp. CCB-MM4]OZG69806.1 GGDEF domain-containing protein [Hahella sp. CCB-MM4]
MKKFFQTASSVNIAFFMGLVFSAGVVALTYWKPTNLPWTLLSAVTVSAAFAIFSIVQIKLNRQLAHKVRELRERDFKLKKLGNAVTNSGSLIIITDELGNIEYVNNKFIKTTGYSLLEVKGCFLNILNPDNHHSATEQYWEHDLLVDGWEGDVLSCRKTGTSFWSAVSISSVSDNQGTITNYVISCIDITELKEANSKMQIMALYDPLTGLANRRLFIDRLEQSVRAAKRDRKKIALMFLDLDQFKRINDTLGHDAGDILLTTVSNRLKECVREKDTVARLGGDEFTVLLTDVDDNLSVTPVAHQILRALKKPIKLKKHEVIVSTSIGITLAPTDGCTADSLMKNADLALYRAKEQGRDCYHFFTEELNASALRQLVLEQELRHALQYDEFTLHFQPQVNLRSERIVSVEALLRWYHPTKGLVSPDAFIPVAEETGLIVPIGKWVLKNACMQMKMIQDLTGVDIKIAVNLSTRQFDDPDLEEMIADALRETGLEPRFLELEVTESMLMGDIDLVIEKLKRLKSTGVSITIDDFGSGYSSLSYLKKLPVDILKVDREFVRDIPDDLNDMEITSAVIAVAHKLNLKVIAEGVEDIDQRDFLMINKCDFAQGFFFSKPLPFEDLYQYLTRGKLAESA